MPRRACRNRSQWRIVRMMHVKDAVLTAEKKIRPYIRETPLEQSFFLSEHSGCQAYLKLESIQITGSFKARGAFSKLLSLSDKERKSGIVTASTGNHGLAVAYASKALDLNVTIFLPENASPQKIELLKKYPVKLKFFGNDSEETETAARNSASHNRQLYISPYNDPYVIGGQGTIGVELSNQLSSIDTLFVSVGGGGLISGIAGYLKEMGKNVNIIGCLPQNSPAMFDAVKKGAVVESRSLPTLSDGTAGGIETDAITLELCAHYVDDWIMVTEDEIRLAMKRVFESHRFVIEGAAGVAVASFLKLGKKLRGRNVAIVICGGNIDIAKFKELVF